MGLESVISFFGNKWNEVSRYLNGDFSKSTPDEKIKCAENVRTICALTAAMVAPQPIPIADIWIITPIQYTMVRAIGNIYGYKLSEGRKYCRNCSSYWWWHDWSTGLPRVV